MLHQRQIVTWPESAHTQARGSNVFPMGNHLTLQCSKKGLLGSEVPSSEMTDLVFNSESFGMIGPLILTGANLEHAIRIFPCPTLPGVARDMACHRAINEIAP